MLQYNAHLLLGHDVELKAPGIEFKWCAGLFIGLSEFRLR